MFTFTDGGVELKADLQDRIQREMVRGIIARVANRQAIEFDQRMRNTLGEDSIIYNLLRLNREQQTTAREFWNISSEREEELAREYQERQAQAQS